MNKGRTIFYAKNANVKCARMCMCESKEAL